MKEVNEIIMTCRSGSHLYGTTTLTSDTDFVSIFIPKKSYILGLDRVEQISLGTKKSNEKRVNNSSDCDHTAYTLRRFIELLLKNNINIIELLFAKEKQSLVVTSDIFTQLQNMSSIIISKLVFKSFFGYACSQEILLDTKTRRLNALNEGIELLNGMVGENLSEIQAFVLTNSQSTYKHNNSYRTYHKGLSIAKIKKELQDDIDAYGHRKKNIEDKGYEIKFASHVIRILHEGIELAQTGELHYPLQNADEIIKIKTGNETYENVMSRIKELKEQFRLEEQKSGLRETPDYNKLNEFLINIYGEKV